MAAAVAAKHAKHFNTIMTFCVRVWNRLNHKIQNISFEMSNFYRINTDISADRSYSFVRLRHAYSERAAPANVYANE